MLIRTEDQMAGRRLEAWRGVVCDTLGPLDVRIDPDVPLRGEIEAGEVGAVRVGRIDTTTPSSVHRTAGLIRRATAPVYRVVLALSGRPRVAQDGKSAQLKPGEFAIYDFGRPYDLGYDDAVELGVFSIPHELLALPYPSVARLTAVPIGGDGAVGGLAAPLLRRVVLDHEHYAPASAARLSTVMADLITTAVAERIEHDALVPRETRDQTLLLRVKAFIEQELGRSDLDPGTVAVAHHISVRQLHRLFEAESMTVAAWIRHRRLERCRADLTDVSLRTLTVSAVGAR
jgi:AraC-like DNA-binding protein